MSINLGTAFLSIVPEFRTGSRELQAGAESEGSAIGKTFAIAAGAAIAASVAIGAGLKKAYDIGAVFDDVSDTIRVGTGASGAALEGLAAVAKNVATTIPTDFAKAGSTVADLNTRLGLSGDSLQTVASQFLEAGRILGSDVDINSATAAFSAFGIKGDDVSKQMDNLFRVSQATGVGLNELTSAASAQAPALQELGFNFQDTISLIGSLDKAGLDSTAITASMGKGLVKLAKDGEQPQEAFQRITGQLTDLVAQGDNASAIDLASGIFGTKGANQFVGAIQSGTLSMDDLMAATGATQDTILGVAQETNDAAESWTLFKNKATAALQPVGDAVFGLAGDAMSTLTGSVDDVAAAFDLLRTGDFKGGIFGLAEDSPAITALLALRDGAIELGGILGGALKDAWDQIAPIFMQVGSILGPAIVQVFDTLKPAIQQLLPVITQLLPVFNPVSLIFKALLPVLPQIADMVGKLANVLATFVAGALTSLAPLFQKVVDVINRLLPFVTELITSLLPPLMGLFDKLAPLLDAILAALLPVVDEIVNGLMWAIDALMPVVERVFGFIGTTIENIMTVLGGLIDFVTGVFTGDWSKAWEGIKTMFVGVWEQMKASFQLIWDYIQAILGAGWNWIRDYVFTPLGAGVEALEVFFSGLWTTVSDVWGWIQTKLGEVWNWINTNVFAPLGVGISSVGTFFSDLWTTVSQVWTDIQDKISTVWTWINQNIFAPMNLAIGTIGTFMSNLWNTVSTVWNNIKTFFSDIATAISGAVETVKKAIEDILTAVKGFFIRVAGGSEEGGVFNNLQGALGAPRSAGGIIPGTDPGRGVDNVLTPMRSGEAVMVPEWTQAVGGASTVHAMNRAAEQGRLSDILGDGFAAGGVIGQRYGQVGGQIAKDRITVYVQAILDKKLAELQQASSSANLAEFNNSQDPSSFGWKQGANIVPYSFGGFPFPAGVAGGTEGLWNSLLSALVPKIPGGLMQGSNWGYENRANKNSPGNASFHSYGLALDVNAPANPNGASGYGRSGQYVIPSGPAHSLAGQNGMLWGGDFTGTPDPMHFEIHLPPSAIGGGGGGPVGGPTSTTGGGFPEMVERWRGTAEASLKFLNESLSNTNNVLNQIRTESSGDPRAINLTDSNARKGTPSKGLVQVIDPTFDAYAVSPYNKDIWDPMSNLVAGENYARHAYGSIAAGMRGVAYDNGGWLMPQGGGFNFLDRPEAVLTPEQSSALIAHARDVEAGFNGGASAADIREALQGSTFRLEDGGNTIRLIATSVLATQSRVNRINGGR